MKRREKSGGNWGRINKTPVVKEVVTKELQPGSIYISCTMALLALNNKSSSKREALNIITGMLRWTKNGGSYLIRNIFQLLKRSAAFIIQSKISGAFNE